MAEKICPSCGSTVPDSSQFCTICGVRLSGEASEKEQPAEAVTETPAAAPVPPAAPAVTGEVSAENEPAPMPPVSEEKERPWAETVSNQYNSYSVPAAPAPMLEMKPAQPSAAEREKQRKANLPMSSVGTALSIVLMSIPLIGLVIAIIWACGCCRKIGRRNLARAYIILLAIGVVLAIAAALLLRFVFADDLIALFEKMVPGYTIQFS